MSDQEIWRSDAVGLAEMIRQKKIGAAELLQLFRRRIASINPHLNAVVRLEEDASEAAGKIDSALPFAGVPILIKDFLALVAGSPTSSGAAFLRDFTPAEDSTLVRRYRQAGFCVMGKTNTPEMAISASTEPALFGPTRNPYALDRSAGGSSGGSAAAVAAGLAPVAHATDGGGSIRIPAAACGLVGLKPSRGWSSMGPLLGESLAGAAVEHVVTRSVRDCAAVFQLTSGPEDGDPYRAGHAATMALDELRKPTGRLRIGVSARPPFPCPVAPECAAALDRAAALCADLGHIVDEVNLEIDEEALDRSFAIAMCVNIASTLALRAGDRAYSAADFEPVTWAMVERGRAASGIDYLRAVQTFHRLGRQTAPFFRRHDLLLTPTLAMLPPPLGWLDTRMNELDAFLQRLFSFAPFTRLWNCTGQPAISLPLAESNEGIPIGIQAVARFGDEATLFRFAAQVEAANPWADRWPAIAARPF